MPSLETHTIMSADASVSATFVPERGGAMSSLLMQGQQGARELLFLHDYFWDIESERFPGGWPFCFPVCARLLNQQYQYESQTYPLKIHGFAWRMAWQVEQLDQSSIVLLLRDTAETHVQYPFEFEVRLQYQLDHNRLTCRQTYSNLSDKPMPYYAGFHPYFLTPGVDQGKEKVMLNYQPVKRFVYNDDFTDVIGETELFHLPSPITNPELNEQLTQVGKHKEAILTYPDGDCLHILAEGVEDPDLFPYIQLYTMADKPFFCVEPWMSHPNAMNRHAARVLAPGQSELGVLHVWLSHHC